MIGLNAVPLSALSGESRNLLSERLNPRKVLPIRSHDGITRHRDWRGVASLVPISAEVAASINGVQDQMSKVLGIWISKNDGTANFSRLLDILQLLDRYDVCEDLLELARDNRLFKQENHNDNNQIVIAIDGSDENIITYDDKLFGTPQRYHAYVLYAKEDKIFVEELLTRMRSEGFKLCTEEDLLPGHATEFEPVSRLISERCRYIVLVYSPDFLLSPAIAFYMNLAQADAINKKQSKIIPLMYRECVLPRHLAYYHNLRYPHPQNGLRPPYNFWERLSNSLRIVDRPRSNSTETTHSKIKIVEESNTQNMSNGYQVSQANGYKNHLALPEIPKESSSLIDLRSTHIEIPSIHSFETKSLSSSSTSEVKKKKYGAIRKFINTFRGKKEKKAIAVEN
ncbi:myeloid differentiation primary response protein MyD88-like isoform X1 [Maniola jurtina]|uniref:myeloid differentiation primary response protein MyD88-like isoform X1 n=1 Tax=Maniola jurtina TaxID=191418 RepID=UPI001E68698C|nr:myeloid differentiation primary response protein MyD88-like isoform X1 [Maniola jurtina]